MKNYTPEWLQREYLSAQEACRDWIDLLGLSRTPYVLGTTLFFEQPSMPIEVPVELDGVDLMVWFSGMIPGKYRKTAQCILNIQIGEVAYWVKILNNKKYEDRQEILECSLKLLKLQKLKMLKIKKVLEDRERADRNFLEMCENLGIKEIRKSHDNLYTITHGMEMMSLPKAAGLVRCTLMLPYERVEEVLSRFGVDYLDSEKRLLYRGQVSQRTKDADSERYVPPEEESDDVV